MAELVHRSPRVLLPAPSSTFFEIQAPPPLEPPARLQPMQLLLPVLGSLSILVYGVMARTAVLLVTGGIMALASLASPLVLHWTGRRAQSTRIAARRQRYLAHLAEVAAAVDTASAALSAAAAHVHPTPPAHEAWLTGRRLWERRLEDGDLLHVSLGTADVPSGLVVTGPRPNSVDADPDEELTREAEHLEAAARTRRAAPLVLDVAEAGVVAVTGDRPAVLGLVRAVLVELALTTAPGDVCIAAAFPPAELEAWAWLKWLPHAAVGAAGLHGRPAERLLATNAAALESHLLGLVGPRLRMLDERTWGGARAVFPRAVVVVDHFDPISELSLSSTLTQTLAHAAEVGVSVIALCDSASHAPTQTTTVITVKNDGGELRRVGGAATAQRFDPLTMPAAASERLARRLAPKRLVAGSVRAGRAGSGRLAELLEGGLLASPAPGAPACGDWPEVAPSQLLRIPFGVTAAGSPAVLDLKESADGGHGPHGLVVGAVGSGKSELLRTLVTGLVATHPPEDVELAFADFKGGLTFSVLHEVPHARGMITNLGDDLTLVDRMKSALAGELERRQRQLRTAGADVQRIGQYRELRRERPDLDPMPYLVVVVDEFGELLEVRPDVLEVLLSVARTGRSLGVHLVLASQRLETGRIRGLDSYLGYRICLRTFTAEDSLAILGSRLAADLPALPGHGYLRTASGLVRFLAATVSEPAEQVGRQAVRPFDPCEVAVRPEADPGDGGRSRTAGTTGDGDLARLVERANHAGGSRRRPPLWLPPLPRPGRPGALTLRDRRLDLPVSSPAKGLPVAVGLVDLPAARRQVALTLDPASRGGHLLVVGGPHTGKTTVLAAFALQAARRHSAALLRFHVADLGGGGLTPLASLPNVSAYTDGQDPDDVGSVFADLEGLLEDRVRRMRRHGVHSPSRWRELVADGVVDGPAHTVLLLDQLVTFRERFPDLDPVLGRLLVEGPNAGVHVAMTSARWAELPAKRLEQVSARLELRLNDPLESLHGRLAASAVPVGVPGRGLVEAALIAQIADPGDLDRAVTAARASARRHWPGVAAPALRRLRDLAPGEWAESTHTTTASGSLLLGVAEPGLAAIGLEPGGGTSLLAYGDQGTGRSAFLARLLTGAAALPERGRPRVYVIDYLGSLMDRCPDTSAMAAAAYGPDEAPDLLASLVEELSARQREHAQARRDGARLPAKQPLWLVVDDYELVHAAARPGMVADLAGLVPYAGQLGLGLVLNQGAAGSSTRIDPLVRRVLENAPWHLRFGVESRLELLLTGSRGAALPPGQAVLTRPGRPDVLLGVLPPVATVPSDGSRPRIRLVS